MKKYLSLLSVIVASTMLTTAFAETTDGFVKVVSLKGAARTMPDGKAIKVGAILKPGVIIQTAADSYVDLVLNNAKATQGLSSAVTDDASIPAATASAAAGGSSGYKPKAVQDAIRIFENSVISVDKLVVTKTGAETVTETQLDLKAGKIFGTVKKLSAASVYEIKVPNGVAGIRGTIYLIGADGTLAVLTGAVVVSFVSNGAVVTKEVPAGFQFNPGSGEVTPITSPLGKVMMKLAERFEKYFPGIAVPGTTYIHDGTVIIVSPTTSDRRTGSSGSGSGDGVGAGDGAP